MRALVQRVSEASVDHVPDEGPAERVGAIGRGLALLVGVAREDDRTAARRVADKVHRLRVFDDERGVPNLSCADVGGEILVVSQFTLYADVRRGRRPSYVGAAPPEQAEPLIGALVERLGELGARVATGRFGARMRLRVVNEGPWTVLVEL